MKKTALLFCLAGFLLANPVALAQDEADNGKKADTEESGNATDAENKMVFWQASLPSGHFMVALGRIANISMHEYLLDGQLIVNEMVVDSGGRSIARFYHVKTIAEDSPSATTRRVVEKGKELIDRAGEKAGTDIHEMVQKSYPTTSHAGMVEYRLMDIRDLHSLYRSVKTAWETGKGRTITVKQ
ncbi:MAG TPA: hypothetical protein VGE67_09520 [Haloferula sp.]